MGHVTQQSDFLGCENGVYTQMAILMEDIVINE